MIDLYYWPTPNGHKVTIFLEETGLDYKIVPVNIGKGEQFTPEFLKISPNNRMPAIVDHQGPGGKPLSLFETGGVGPMFGQRGHFMRAAPEKIPYAIERYTNESRRLLNVMEKRLGEADYLAG